MELVMIALLGALLVWIADQFVNCGPRRIPMTHERAEEILKEHRGKVVRAIEWQGYERPSGYRLQVA